MLTIEQILDLDDEKIQEIIAKDLGMEINDPFSDIKFKDFHQKYLDPLDEESIDKIKKEIDESN